MTDISLYEKSSGGVKETAVQDEIQPMPFWLSLLLFGIPAAVMIVSLTIGIPLLERLGIEPIVSFLTAFTVPMALMFTAALDQAAGGTLRGRWDIVALYLVFLFFNIAGEELWWRGTILPRQELRHGRLAWLVHGLLWALFHVFKWWSVITIVPMCLAVAFSSQRLKTNWPAATAHLLGNLSFFLLVLAGVLGVL